MRENRPYGSEGGVAGQPAIPTPIPLKVELVRHSQRKRGATDRLHLLEHRASPRPYLERARGGQLPPATRSAGLLGPVRGPSVKSRVGSAERGAAAQEEGCENPDQVPGAGIEVVRVLGSSS